MKNVMKAATLESKFPLLAVENGCVVSKEADVTVAFRVELPELFSVTEMCIRDRCERFGSALTRSI